MDLLGRLDNYQRGHTWLGMPLATVYKFFDDRGVYLAALIAYYGFVSLFPLLLLLLTVLGYALHGNPDLQHKLVSSALVDFPIIGPQLQRNVQGYTGNSTAVVIGILGTLYGGIGITQATQAAFNRIYGVPRNSQPNPLTSRLRSLLLLFVLGTGVLVTTGLSALVSTANAVGNGLGPWLSLGARLLTVVLNIALFVAAFQLLTARRLRIRRVLVGGVIAGVAWYLLQIVGTGLLSRRLNHAAELYGTFGLVLGTLAWIYVEGLVVMFCAELNVVLHERLWPRALLTPFTDAVDLTDADRRVYSSYSKSERYKGYQRIEVSFDKPADAVEGSSPESEPAPGPEAEQNEPLR